MRDSMNLSALPLFKGLLPAQLDELRNQLHTVERPPKHRLIAADDASDAVFIVLSGTVKICIDQAARDEVILALLGEGALIGEIGVVQSARRSANVITLEPARLLQMHHADFLRALERYPAMALNLSAILGQRLRVANGRLLAHAATSEYGRAARMILVLVQEHGIQQDDGSLRIPVRITQSDLANMIGAGRVWVNRAMTALKREGVLNIATNYHITVHDLAALERYC